MGEFNVLVYRLLDELSIFLLVRLGDDVPYELLDAGVNVLLVVSRHGRIFAASVGRRERLGIGLWYGQEKGARVVRQSSGCRCDISRGGGSACEVGC